MTYGFFNERQKTLKLYLDNHFGPEIDLSKRIEDCIEKATKTETSIILAESHDLSEPTKRYERLIGKIIGKDLKERMDDVAHQLNHQNLAVPKETNPINYTVIMNYIKMILKADKKSFTGIGASNKIKKFSEKLPNPKDKSDLHDFYIKSLDILFNLRYHCNSSYLNKVYKKIPGLFSNYERMKDSFDETSTCFGRMNTEKAIMKSFNALIREYDELTFPK